MALRQGRADSGAVARRGSGKILFVRASSVRVSYGFLRLKIHLSWDK